MNEAMRRALRGVFQVTTAEAIIQFLHVFVVTLSPEQQHAALALLVIAVTFVQNLLETRGTVPTMLRAPEEPRS